MLEVAHRMTNMARQNNQMSVIARLMNEDGDMTAQLGGGETSGAFSMRGSDTEESEYLEQDDEERGGFTAKDLKIAKRFVELMGGADRAREIVDKVDECQDCLELIDDEEVQKRDGSAIEHMAGFMPSTPDLPMLGKAAHGMSALYNPDAGHVAM